MKKAFTALLICIFTPLFAQQLSPMQTAVLNNDTASIEKLSADGADLLFVRKPSRAAEAELLLDFALANGKLAAYNFLIAKGAQPGIATVFTAVKSGSYILARQLVESGNLVVYKAALPPVPRYTISNLLTTNIAASFYTNTFTNISQFAVTNALGQLSLREYTNIAEHHITNIFTNITSKVITNTFQSPQSPAAAESRPLIDYITLTNIAFAPITNYKDQIYTYIFTNDMGQSAEKTITNIILDISEGLSTNIIRRPVANSAPVPLAQAPLGYTVTPVSLSRLNFIDLARIAESQGSKETSTYFLEKAKALE